MAPGLSEYELQRQKNVEENLRILQGIRQEQVRFCLNMDAVFYLNQVINNG